MFGLVLHLLCCSPRFESGFRISGSPMIAGKPKAAGVFLPVEMDISNMPRA